MSSFCIDYKAQRSSSLHVLSMTLTKTARMLVSLFSPRTLDPITPSSVPSNSAPKALFLFSASMHPCVSHLTRLCLDRSKFVATLMRFRYFSTHELRSGPLIESHVSSARQILPNRFLDLFSMASNHNALVLVSILGIRAVMFAWLQLRQLSSRDCRSTWCSTRGDRLASSSSIGI